MSSARPTSSSAIRLQSAYTNVHSPICSSPAPVKKRVVAPEVTHASPKRDVSDENVDANNELFSPPLHASQLSQSYETTLLDDDEDHVFTDADAFPNAFAFVDDDDQYSSHADDDVEKEVGAQAESDVVFDPFLFMSQLPPYRYVREFHAFNGSPSLPNEKRFPNRLDLVLDLDETLVHCSMEAFANYDFTFQVNFQNAPCTVYVRKRPLLDEFLEHASRHFEVTLFTASQRVYADALLDILDPSRKLIHHRLFRESCLVVGGNFIKDLEHVFESTKRSDLSRVVLVDNSPHAFSYQIDNGVPIESWYEDPHDLELKKLGTFLHTLKEVDDVRRHVREEFKTYKRIIDAERNATSLERELHRPVVENAPRASKRLFRDEENEE